MKVILFNKNNLKSKTISFSVILLILLVLIFSNKIADTIKFNVSLTLNTLIPSLLPLILISSIIICSNSAKTIAAPFTKLITKVFHLNSKLAPAVVIGSLMGFPNAARYIASANDNSLSSDELTALISYTSNANPAYIYTTVGTIFAFSNCISIILLVSVVISSFIVGIILRPTLNTDIIQQQSKYLNSTVKNVSTSQIISASIISCFKTLAMVFTFTTIFSFLSSIFVSSLHLTPTKAAIITAVIELTNGLNMLASLHISLEQKIILTSFFVSFSSVMIICQVYMATQGCKIKLLKLIIYKFIQGLISALITFLLISITNVNIFSVPVFSNIEAISISRGPELIYIFSVLVFFIYLYIVNKKTKSAIK